ncbi:MAG: alcohol dehydrogenase catalytic domain-containing protein, partial [Planctomycetes bacterium]|nr:alcohol dehydrogenase catalytic domain-containing protein [Planctomycetota bacterium]
MDSLLAIFHGPGLAIELRRVPLPPLGPGEVLVRNTCTTLCRSDVTTFTGKRTEKTPTILGHEITGVIAELGPEAPTQDLRGAPLRPGDRVTWAIYASDP